MSQNDIQQCIDSAVSRAREVYDDRHDEYYLDSGHVWIEGLDGRTTLARELKRHPNVRVVSGGYGGTTVNLEFVSCQSTTVKQSVARAFLSELQNNGYGNSLTIRSHMS